MTSWFLYLIRTDDNRLYTGITTNVARRFARHQAGKGAKALRGKGDLELVFSQQIGDHRLALRVEYRVKRLVKSQKEQLVAAGKLPKALLDPLISAAPESINQAG